MLKRDWPGNFSRTITTGKKGKEVTERLTFSPGVPVDLSAAQIEQLRPDIGVSLMPVDFDEKARPRIITDDVSVDDAASVDSQNESQSAN